MTKPKSITKAHIIKRLMTECNFSHDEAVLANDCLTRIFEEAVTNLTKIHIGHVGTLSPKVLKSKSVSMNFSRNGNKVERTQKYFFLDPRVRFSFRLYKSFADRVEFNHARS
jgi:nucleoid DNA-binding protein